MYKANLEAFGPEFEKILADHPETEIEIEDRVEVGGLKNPTYLVIVGFSGLSTLEAAKRSKKRIDNVLIIEPSLSIFKQTIKRHYIGHLAHDQTVDVLVGIPPEQLGPHLLQIFTRIDSKGSRVTKAISPEIVFDPFVYLDPDRKMHPVGDAVLKEVLNAAKQLQLSMGCASDSHYRWEQVVRNEENFKKCFRIAPLFDQFKDMPAIVLGAGPSLQEFIDAYDPRMRDSALIIACDAALRRLLDSGIRPHLVTRCERKYSAIFRGVSRDDTRGIGFASYPWVDPRFFDLFDEAFMLFRGNGACKFTRPYDFGDVDGGVSAANAGLELALLFGSKEIFLSGIDLCFLDGRSHAEGTQVEFNPETSKAKWEEVENNQGEKVTTIPVWKRCLQEYQTSIAKHAGHGPIYNLSARGAKIVGTVSIPIVEAVDRIKHKTPSTTPEKIIESKKDRYPEAYLESFRKKKKEQAEYLSQVINDLEKLFLSLDDHMLLGKREEERCVYSLRGVHDPNEFFKSVDQVSKNLSSVYAKACTEIDDFKRKYYTDKRFSESIMDICMLDLTNSEHRCNATANLIDREHEKLRAYISLHVSFFRTAEYYAKKLVDLFIKGCDQSVEYNDDPLECA